MEASAHAASSRPTHPLDRAEVAQIAGIAAAPLVLAGLGLGHPHALTAETADWWHTLHLVLIPIFPLLGANIWWLLAGLPGALAWLGRAAAFVYAAFYGALDVLAGVGTGLVYLRAGRVGRPELLDVVPWLFAEGNDLAEVGVLAFLVACLVASGLLMARAGRAALPGAVLLCGSAVLFLGSHIYFPVGVATMLAMAAGFALLQWARLRSAPGALASAAAAGAGTAGA